MPLYVVPRTRAWENEEEFAADIDCLPSVTAALPDDVRWMRLPTDAIKPVARIAQAASA
jgi:hypothetical protein